MKRDPKSCRGVDRCGDTYGDGDMSRKCEQDVEIDLNV